MTRDLNDMLDWVRRLIARRYQGHSELEDLMQEGQIAVWRAWMDGERDHQQLIYKGMNRAGDLLKNGKPFGKPRADRPVNRKTGAVTREKLRAFIDEYVRLHGKKPTYKEMGEAAGISHQSVAVHLKRLYMFSDEPQELQIESFDRFPDAEDLGYFAVDPGFDEHVTDKLWVQELMADLPDVQKEAVYLRFWEDQTFPAIAKTQGLTNPAGGEYRVKSGLKALKARVST